MRLSHHQRSLSLRHPLVPHSTFPSDRVVAIAGFTHLISNSYTKLERKSVDKSNERTAFWSSYLATLPADHPHHNVSFGAWGFGDSPEMADELGLLVLNGIKSATVSLVKEYETEGTPVPPVGDVNIILNGAGAPLCIIETTEITIKPLNQVDAQFAWDEGEDDRTLASWTAGHERYFKRLCAAKGWTYTDDMLTVFERFKVIYRGAKPA